MTSLAADGLDLLFEDARSEATWRARIACDREHAEAVQTAELRCATERVLAQAVEGGAGAVALTGSTVRGRRHASSDLDFLVVGERPSLLGIELDVDVYAAGADTLLERLRDGDDYVQWTLRFGCVLFDTGPLHAAAQELVRSARWPSPERKLAQVRRMLRVAEHVVDSGDRDAACEQVRSAVTGVARWQLLANGAFPLSRSELPAQLRAADRADVASVLERCMAGDLSIEELREGLACAQALVAAAGAVALPARG